MFKVIYMVSFKPRQYQYRSRLKWTANDQGETLSKGNPPIKIALPENLGGPGRAWSPDEMFVASAEACAMLTFFWLLRDKEVEIKSYESEAEGVSQIDSDGTFRFTKIIIMPVITIAKEEHKLDVKTAVKQLDDNCCVSNSMKGEVVIDAEIKLG
jgi:peroxiredoxin-like protein